MTEPTAVFRSEEAGKRLLAVDDQLSFVERVGKYKELGFAGDLRDALVLFQNDIRDCASVAVNLGAKPYPPGMRPTQSEIDAFESLKASGKLTGDAAVKANERLVEYAMRAIGAACGAFSEAFQEHCLKQKGANRAE